MSRYFYRHTPQASECVDVAVIGAGPAGLSAGAYLASTDLEFVILEAGPSAALRRRDDPRTIVSGVGGAGLYSDGKFSFFPSASGLWQLTYGRDRLRLAYDWLSSLLRSEGANTPLFPTQLTEPTLRPGEHFKNYPSQYLPFSNRQHLGEVLSNLVGGALRTEHDVIGVQSLPDGYRIFVDTPQGPRALAARHVILATGRFGPRDLARMLPEFPTVFRRHEVGLRLEQPSSSFVFAQHPAVDVKQIVPAASVDAEWRTFCTCRDGEVVKTAWRGIVSFSGRANGARTGRSNVGLNLRLTAPPSNETEAEAWSIVNGHVPPFRVPLLEYLDSSNRLIYLGPQLDAVFRQRLSAWIDRAAAVSTTVYCPCIEGVGYYPDVNEALKINSHDIWVAGDAAGLFRGLTAAFVSGYYTAQSVHAFIKNSHELPRFIKHSPSNPMAVVFTAQSKQFFYCRDAVCEFVLRNGYLALNPFRVFDYFLGDRIDRDIIRQGNNQLVAMSDEVWVFGTVSDGVLFEIVRARRMRKPVRFYSISTRADEIKPVAPSEVKFEPEVHGFQIRREDLLALLTDTLSPDENDISPLQLGLSLD